MNVIDIIAVVVSFLILVLGVATRFKYVWQGNKIRRRKSARDVSRKFHIASWVVYVLQVFHCAYIGDWVNVAFWTVGVFTVAFCVLMCRVHWHVKMPFGRWLIDSFRGEEEGGLWR